MNQPDELSLENIFTKWAKHQTEGCHLLGILTKLKEMISKNVP